MIKELFVVRHGETELNREGRLQGSGQPDLPINTTGIAEVLLIKQRLLTHLDRAYVSPSLRTRQTADILLRDRNIPRSIEPDLCERNFGSLSGMLRSEVNPEILAHDFDRGYDYRRFGGDSHEEVTERIVGFLKRLAETPKDRCILLVTHRGVIRILREIAGAEPDEIAPASFHRFTLFEDGHIVLR